VQNKPKADSDNISMMEDNLRFTLPIVTKQQVSEASTNNNDALRDKDRY